MTLTNFANVTFGNIALSLILRNLFYLIFTSGKYSIEIEC